MLILPLHRKPTRENLPVLTVLLVLANILVFTVFQWNDSAVEQRAAERYVATGVVEHEWNWFRDWASTIRASSARPEEIDRFLPEVGRSDDADLIRFLTIESEPGFVQAVREEWFVDADSKVYRQWSSARRKLELDREESFTRRYLLGYDQVSAINFVTHMFMHGGLMHLIGNMLFLVLLGILLEPALGAARMLAVYLVGGLGAAGLSLAIHWGESGGMVGASGAIAALMGLLAVVYGMRRIRFFYWFFVYFDYVRAPALVLLPLWLGWEVLAFLIDEGGNVAYDAHIGGIVSGAMLGLLLVRTGQVRTHWLDGMEEDHRLSDDRRSAEGAKVALEALDAAAAKRKLRPLLARYETDTELLRLYLAACQLGADDPELHQAAARIFRLGGDSEDERDLVAETLGRYLDATGERPRLQVAQALTLARRLIAWDRLAAARRLVALLARARRPIPGLAGVSAELVRRMEAKGASAGETERYRRLAGSDAQSS